MSSSNIFSIATYNCKGFKFRNFNYISKLFDKIDILMLQEHWLHDFEFDTFNKILPHSKYVAKTSMNNNTINMGRPYSGVAIIWKNSLTLKIEEVLTVSDRLCAIRLIDGNNDIVLINVYMPCNINEYNEEFIDIIFEIMTIIGGGKGRVL